MAFPGASLPVGVSPDWLPADLRSWNGMTQARRAAGSLRAKEKYDFQRACLPYLQIILDGDAIEVPEMGGWDAAGIDHLAWAENGPGLRAVVQCKGFELSGALGSHPSAGRRMSAVRLSPWTDAEIRALIVRARHRADATGGAEARDHLSELLDLIGGESFAELYGDIPRRPLFLQLLISDVAAEGVRRLDAVALMDSWITRKLRRDLLGPERISPGGGHRPPLVADGESVDTALARSWDLMDEAAGHTLPSAPVADTEPELEPSVRWESLVTALPWLDARRDLAAISTRTLLVPLGPHTAGRSLRLTFAHRAFQEFFAARHVLGRGCSEDGLIPSSVREWTHRMSAAGYP